MTVSHTRESYFDVKTTFGLFIANLFPLYFMVAGESAAIRLRLLCLCASCLGLCGYCDGFWPGGELTLVCSLDISFRDQMYCWSQSTVANPTPYGGFPERYYGGIC